MTISTDNPSRNRAKRAQEYLKKCDAHFVPELKMTQVRWQGPGYHSQYPEGEWAAPTRENLDYALTLLDEGSPSSLERAEAIVRAILPLQDWDPVSMNYGIWPWLLEEPLDQMAPPDWNWADFCGVRLSHILGCYSDRLTPALTDCIKVALNAAAFSIFRRNVGPGYTNIAVKGGIVCAYAGQLLSIEELANYGQRRLEDFIAFTQQRGGFQEYNSPTYGVLVLMEIERGMMLINDPSIRTLLHKIHRMYWEQTAYSLHVGLGQVCGPQSRGYADWLTPTTARIIGERLDSDLPVYGDESNEKLDIDFLLTPIPCPSDIREKILNASDNSFARYTYIQAEQPDRRRDSAVWKSAHACIGSINYDNLWTQRRPVLGYWRTGESVAVLRIRLLHAGQDFASGVLRTQQEHNHLVSIVSLLTDKGDYHDHLDRPSSGTFEIKDFEMRIELTAPDALASELGDHTWRLQAGSHGAQIQPAFASLSGHKIEWQAWTRDGQAGLSARIDQGSTIQLNPSELAEAAFGFYLTVNESATAPIELSADKKDGTLRITANSGSHNITVSAPLRPEAYSPPC